jgi:hypothetical protein|tara:strand:- start:967 stop:1185 length:219 start_codon:yes stop_codon:yes gene_type:complete
MERSELSWMYHFACDRIHEVVDDLYEAIHNNQGYPQEDFEKVYQEVLESKSKIYQELDLIKTVIDEYQAKSQ